MAKEDEMTELSWLSTLPPARDPARDCDEAGFCITVYGDLAGLDDSEWLESTERPDSRHRLKAALRCLPMVAIKVILFSAMVGWCYRPDTGKRWRGRLCELGVEPTFCPNPAPAFTSWFWGS